MPYVGVRVKLENSDGAYIVTSKLFGSNLEIDPEDLKSKIICRSNAIRKSLYNENTPETLNDVLAKEYEGKALYIQTEFFYTNGSVYGDMKFIGEDEDG